MKTVLPILALVFLVGCSSEAPIELENTVYIGGLVTASGQTVRVVFNGESASGAQLMFDTDENNVFDDIIINMYPLRAKPLTYKSSHVSQNGSSL